MPERRVVVTGIGIISSAGISKKEFWNNIISGNNCINEITYFDTNKLSCKIAAQIKGFKADDYILRKDVRRMDRFVQYACAASLCALEDADWKINQNKSERIGVWVGSSIGGMDTFEKQYDAMLSRGTDGVSPFFIPMFIPNMAAGQISILTGAKGPCGCSINGSASGSQSIYGAWNISRAC